MSLELRKKKIPEAENTHANIHSPLQLQNSYVLLPCMANMYTDHFICSEEQSLWQKNIVYLCKQEHRYTLFRSDSIHVTVRTNVGGGEWEARFS